MDVNITCPCPGTPHPDGDTVTLRDKPTLPMGLGTTTMLSNLDQSDAIDAATLTGRIAEVWVMEGIVSWTLVDEAGQPRPSDRANIREFMSDFTVIFPVADAAASLYSEAILNPLVKGSSESSRPGPTAPSTSHTSEPSSKRRSPSTPSSPDTSEATTPSEE